jgi:hypothetical protein
VCHVVHKTISELKCAILTNLLFVDKENTDTSSIEFFWPQTGGGMSSSDIRWVFPALVALEFRHGFVIDENSLHRKCLLDCHSRCIMSSC